MIGLFITFNFTVFIIIIIIFISINFTAIIKFMIKV